MALDGGPDGLDVIRRLLDLLPGTLAADGVALLEIGADQGEGIARETAARLAGLDLRRDGGPRGAAAGGADRPAA